MNTGHGCLRNRDFNTTRRREEAIKKNGSFSATILQPYQAVMKLIIGNHGNENEKGKNGRKQNSRGGSHSKSERKGRKVEKSRREIAKEG